MGILIEIINAVLDAVLDRSAQREIGRAHDYSRKHPGKPPKTLSVNAKTHIYNTATNNLANGMVKTYNRTGGRILGEWDYRDMAARGTNITQLTQAANIAAQKLGGKLTISKQTHRYGAGYGASREDDLHLEETVFTVKK